MGKDEVKLVRKKLKWNYEPFEIPQKILEVWKDIGHKGVKKELKWKKNYNKKKRIIEKTFSNNPKKTFEIEKQNIIKNL